MFLANRVVVLSSGRVLEDMRIDLARPRRWDDLVESEQFKMLTGRVLHLVRSA